jgi:hypothetical protein
MRDQIMAEEDRRIFEQLDNIARGTESDPDYRFMDVSLVQNPTDPRTRLPPLRPGEFSMHEEVGEAYINPAALRVMVPEFEIASNPTISLSEIQNRRFNIREDERLHIRQVQEMTPTEMEAIAIIVRRTAWEKLLDDPAY